MWASFAFQFSFPRRLTDLLFQLEWFICPFHIDSYLSLVFLLRHAEIRTLTIFNFHEIRSTRKIHRGHASNMYCCMYQLSKDKLDKSISISICHDEQSQAENKCKQMSFRRNDLLQETQQK